MPREGRGWPTGTGSGAAAACHVEELPDPFAPESRRDRAAASRPNRATPQRRRWPIVLYAIAGILLVTLIWLVITAPLSRALEPLDDPALLLLSATTASRSPGAARSRKRRSTSTKLNPLTPAAFVAIEDRRFYRHWGIDPRGIGRAMVANMRGGGVRQGGSTITQQLAKTNFLSGDRTHQAQGAGSDHRLLARGVADQGRDPVALSVERLFRRRRLWPARRRAPLFRPRPGESDARPVGDARRAWSRRRRGSRRPTISRLAQKRSRAGARGDGRHRRDQRGAGARRRRWRGRSAQSHQGPDRHLFRRLGRARRASRRSTPISARSRCATTLDCRPAAARGARGRRRRDRRCAGGAGRDAPRRPGRRDGRRQELRGSRRSTAPPRRGASRARRSSCSSISPRCAPAGRPTA